MHAARYDFRMRFEVYSDKVLSLADSVLLRLPSMVPLSLQLISMAMLQQNFFSPSRQWVHWIS